MKIIGLILNFVGLLASLATAFVGWNLSQEPEADASIHLFLAFLILITLILSQILLLKSTQHITADKRDKCLAPAFAVIALSLLSLMTGSISHAGQLPILHGLLGIGICFASANAFIRWTLLK